jgi:hypothetical protein
MSMFAISEDGTASGSTEAVVPGKLHFEWNCASEQERSHADAHEVIAKSKDHKQRGESSTHGWVFYH